MERETIKVWGSWRWTASRVYLQHRLEIWRRGKKVGESGGVVGVIQTLLIIILSSLVQTTWITTTKKRTVQPRDAFEDTVVSRGLKSSNLKPRCRISALDYFVKKMPTMAIWHQTQSDKCFIELLFGQQTLFHCWKGNRGLKLSRN
jgi:hypothetical protein